MPAEPALPAPQKKPSLLPIAGVLTVLALGGGALVGKILAGRIAGATATTEAASPAKPLPYDSATTVSELPAIVTNLADPAETRVRLQVAIVFPTKSVENPTVLAAQVSDDLLAFAKTLTLKNLEGASGFQNLKEDLTDRAAIRSQGKVRELIIEALVLQ